MSNLLSIMELLELIQPEGRCDDCLATELDIQPRQTINAICRPLAEAGRINRLKAACSSCGKVKLINTLAAQTDFGRITQSRPVAPISPITQEKTLDVEKARTEVVRVCMGIWNKTQPDAPPRSISLVINQLRNSGGLPQHIANVMLTLCGLRNVHVYEGQVLGEHELALLTHAYAIVENWRENHSA